MIKVCKFGGSSLANAEQFAKIKEIVSKEEERKIIVASAVGKSDDKDHKVTDLLYLCEAHSQYRMPYDDILSIIINKHQEIIDKLNIDYCLDDDIAKIKKLLSSKTDKDELISMGEYISSKLLAKYLDAEFVDAKDVIVFNYDGSLNIEKTSEQFVPFLNTNKKIVVPGFYGTLPNGVIKTMTRGGSDITGALLANIVDASVYENWTDVSGIYVCDPNLIDLPKQIETVTYDELRELSYMGANVLHDEAIYPVKQKDIPINIRNTNDPDNPGTMIVTKCNDTAKYPITGITGKKDFTVVTVAKTNSSSEIGFLKSVLEVFENYRISIVLVTTGIDSFSIIVNTNDTNNVIYELANEIKNKLNCEDVSIYNNLSLVCVVGRGMKSKLGMSGQIFSLLGENNINIKTISQGADEISIILGVEDNDFDSTIKAIYKRFIAWK